MSRGAALNLGMCESQVVRQPGNKVGRCKNWAQVMAEVTDLGTVHLCHIHAFKFQHYGYVKVFSDDQ